MENPFFRGDTLIEVAKRCRDEGIHTALETAGHLPWSTIKRVLPHIDLLFIDIKTMDPSVHRDHTGASNHRIIDNIRRISATDQSVIVRVPVIPGVNDTEERMADIFQFLRTQTTVTSVQLLPFHRLGAAKYASLGRIYEMGDVQSLTADDCAPFADLGRRYKLNVTVGAQCNARA